jgi:hypothetical protein
MASTTDARSGASNMRESARKNVPAKIPYNPLKRLDPDERIQGNPRKSNTHKRGFRIEIATGQENPHGST